VITHSAHFLSVSNGEKAGIASRHDHHDVM
jgi:hypothetical protein